MMTNTDKQEIKNLVNPRVSSNLDFWLAIILFILNCITYFGTTTFIAESGVQSWNEFANGYVDYVKEKGLQAFTQGHAGTIIIMLLTSLTALGSGVYFFIRGCNKDAVIWMYSMFVILVCYLGVREGIIDLAAMIILFSAVWYYYSAIRRRTLELS